MKEVSEITTTRTINLDHDQLLVLEDGTGTRVRVLFGGVWLTEGSDHRDHFLSTGDDLALHTRQRTVIEPRMPACIQIVKATRRSTLRSWLHVLLLRICALAVWARREPLRT
jgi:hypothetical protein